MQKSNQEKPKTCLASARISTNKQTSGESLDDQVKAIKDFAKREGYTILPDGEVDIEVQSGSKRRPVYENHIQYIKDNPGTVGYYLIRYIDRFTRGGVSMYEDMKKELADLGVTLIDTYGVIQAPTNMPELEALGFEYEWSVGSPSEMAETMEAIRAKSEKTKILQRTIPKQIEYTQKGFQIGRAVDGYLIERKQFSAQIRCVCIPDPDRAHLIRKMFELRAESRLTDQEIVKEMNEKYGYLSKRINKWNASKTAIIGYRGEKKLTIKQLQRIIKRVDYAGFTCEKWTYQKLVKNNWDGLISIELFNAANRGKVFIKDTKNDTYDVLYDYKPERAVYKRLRHNPDYPFKFILCPHCQKNLKGSASTGRGGKKYPKYHCARGHARFVVSMDEMSSTIETFLSKLEFSPEYLEVLKEVLVRKFRQRQANHVSESRSKDDAISLLKTKKERILDKLIDIDSTVVMKILEKQIEEIDQQINQNESMRFAVDLQEHHIKDLIHYAKKIVESPQKALLDKENPLRQKKLFELIFDTIPDYEKLTSGTAQLSFVFNALGEIHTLENRGESLMG